MLLAQDIFDNWKALAGAAIPILYFLGYLASAFKKGREKGQERGRARGRADVSAPATARDRDARPDRPKPIVLQPPPGIPLEAALPPVSAQPPVARAVPSIPPAPFPVRPGAALQPRRPSPADAPPPPALRPPRPQFVERDARPSRLRPRMRQPPIEAAPDVLPEDSLDSIYKSIHVDLSAPTDTEPAARRPRRSESAEELLRVLADRNRVKQAFLLSEILAPPVTLRERHLD